MSNYEAPLGYEIAKLIRGVMDKIPGAIAPGVSKRGEVVSVSEGPHEFTIEVTRQGEFYTATITSWIIFAENETLTLTFRTWLFGHVPPWTANAIRKFTKKRCYLSPAPPTGPYKDPFFSEN